MKYPLLAALLALAKIDLKAGFFGGKSFASFSEEQLDKIEKALEKNDTTAFKEQLEQLNKDIAEQNTRLEGIENAVNTALELNGLEASETLVESIQLLGTTCKEYGEKNSVHTLPKQDGEETNLDDETLIEGYIDPNDEHNKLLKDV